MKNEAANITTTVTAASAGAVVVSNPEMFYETTLWMAATQTGAAAVIFVSLINALYTLRRNRKYKGKDRRKS